MRNPRDPRHESFGPSAPSRRLKIPFFLGAAVLAASAVFLAAGCYYEDDYEDGHHLGYDHHAPSAPVGFYSVTGDESVALYWTANPEDDLDGYVIYRSRDPRGHYPRVATVGRWTTSWVDHNVDNGETYYYALAAIDESGNESELSPDAVQDTPRPEGYELRLYNAATDPERSGYDFSAFHTVDYHDLEADIYYLETEADGAWMVATERSADSFTDIQDAGYLPLDEVDFAPEEGWSTTGEVLLIPGHSYVVWTWDNHFAKFRVDQVNGDRCVLDWAYQVDRGNRELAYDPSGTETARRHAAGGGNRVHRVGAKGR